MDYDHSKISIKSNCPDSPSEINLGTTRNVCGKDLEVKEIVFEESVKIRLNPVNRRIGGFTNFSYGVGVEKRAIQLTPEKAAERIKKLNESIVKWEDINKNLEKAVKGLKAACFATSAALQVKNLFSNLGGKAISRQLVMQEKWNKYCQENVGKYNSINDCYSKHSNEIDSEVKLVNNILDQQQKDLKANDDQNLIQSKGNLFNKKTVDYQSAFEDYKKEVAKDFGTQKILDKDGKNEIEVSNALEGVNDYETLKRIDLHLRIKSQFSNNEALEKAVNERLYDDLKNARDLKINSQVSEGFSERLGEGLSFSGETVQYFSSYRDAKPARYNGAVVTSENNEFNLTVGTHYEPVKVDNEEYLVVLQEATSNQFSLKDVYSVSNGEKLNTDSGVYKTIRQKTAGEFIRFDPNSYKNSYTNPLARYYEREPYKGMPAVVPFDTINGWYAATKQTLPAFGNVKSFEDSGRVASFWVCNVGVNGREEFNSGIGDDICEQINMFTGQTRERFPGLTDEESSRVITRAQRALEDAASQYKQGIRKVKISGVSKEINVGTPQANIPEVQCQNFMSPRDCKILFNVCDPVICPSSRCNLGGKFYVDNVVQSGIIGSTLMCLPNIKEGIAIPVCLTGIHAGVESYVSILKASRDCLQENIDTGRYTGICDEITAIYQCEFFWKQVSPAVNVLLPKLLEGLTGNNPRGGGEYLNVQAAWENMQNSINYFKQDYGENALKAFNVRSSQEAGTQICKGFVSTRYPNKFKTLIEPDSPSQFSAWFDEIPSSDAVSPSVSHYKVFYHIFAGNDIGIQFSVILRNPEGSSFFQSSGDVIVDTGFAPRGGYISEARDFTAPSGFREVCIRTNFQEKCGFKQVSTSFALNYVRDRYIANQLQETNIATEKECISGTPVYKGGSPLALVNPNIQSGVEESLTPTIYERGIIRICSTQNPGRGVDEARFVKVGICGASNIGCWLDKDSITRSITPGNNATIDLLNKLTDERFEKEKLGINLVNDGDIEKVHDEINLLKEAQPKNIKNSYNVIISKLDNFESKDLNDKQEAKVLFMRAKTNDIVAKKLFDSLKETNRTVSEPIPGTTPEPKEDEGDEELTIKEEIYTIYKDITNFNDENQIRKAFSSAEIEINKNYVNSNNELCVKDTTCVKGLKPETVWVALGLGIATDGSMVITGGTEDSEHTKNGKHPQGLAIDIRKHSNNVPNSAAEQIYSDWASKNTQNFISLYGFPKEAISIKDETDHFHIEIDRGKIIEYLGDIIISACLSSLRLIQLSPDSDSTTTFLSPSNSFESQHNEIASEIAEDRNINSNLVLAIIKKESSWDPNAHNSETGARGLMQVTPIALRDVKQRGKDLCSGINDGDSLSSLFNAETNLRYGTCYLKILAEKENIKNTEMIVVAYNWGVGNVKNNCDLTKEISSCSNLPSETSNYLEKVLEYYNEYSGCTS